MGWQRKVAPSLASSFVHPGPGLMTVRSWVRGQSLPYHS
ncbi:hypothetical protein TIFTF001_033151 [Ficus carica]|uniref:Uncharacterized protein n=1 Tax=Ficus carica TaxID=3494 RepID=A0AA88E4S8_FICCA|nr:hypothetical protein TIFTF001_033151 [Ficus carica]